MKKYWIGWYSGGYEDEGCVCETPFQYWWTGERDRPDHGLTPERLAEFNLIDNDDEMYDFLDNHARSTGTAVALVEAESEDEVWETIAQYFPDYEIRFCEEREIDFSPGDRFLDFENRITLTGAK